MGHHRALLEKSWILSTKLLDQGFLKNRLIPIFSFKKFFGQYQHLVVKDFCQLHTVFGSKQTKGPKENSQNLPMPEGGGENLSFINNYTYMTTPY